MEAAPPLSARPIPAPDHPHSKKSASLCADGISRALIYVHCLASCRWALLRSVCLVFTPSHQVFLGIGKMPLGLVSSRLNSPGSLSLPSHVRCSKSLTTFVALCCTLPSKSMSCTGEPSTGPSTPGVSHQGGAEGKDHLLQPAGDALPQAAQEAVGHLRHKC